MSLGGFFMKKRYKPLIIVSLTIVIITFLAAVGFGVCYLYVRKNIDYSADEELFRRAGSFESTVFYGRELCGDGSYIPVKAETSGILEKACIELSEIPDTLIKGFIAVEDRGFYEHSGVDYKRTAYAALNYIVGKERRFGASTITQQVIKNISGDNQPTPSRKLSEILRARHIEKIFTKEEILELYLNVIPMGGNIFGVAEASDRFFGKEPKELTASECAVLIGITNAPTAYSPYSNPTKCLEKRNSILNILHSEGVIDDFELAEAKAAPLEVIPEGERQRGLDSWFTETVIDELCRDLSEKYGIKSGAARLMLLGGGYSVYTTMDITAQRILEEYFENDERFRRAEAIGADYSMVVLDSETADLVAIIGSAGKKQGNRLLNNALVPHIPASSLKPIAIYAPLIDENLISWSTVIDDTPIGFTESDEGMRAYPRNSPDVYSGLTTVKDAIRLSKNTVAIKLCRSVGAERVFEILSEKFGIDSLVREEKKNGRTYSDIGLAPMALGQLTRGISLKKLTECYTTFPSDGILHNSRCYTELKDYEGRVVLSPKNNSQKIFSPETARVMNRLLSLVVDEGTASSLRLKEIVDTAGKTGTSSGNRDKIFVGYTPYYTAGIWCGSNSASVFGLAPSVLSVWDEIMIRLHEALLSFDEQKAFKTEGLVYSPYCMDSGEIYSENCLYDPRGTRMEFGWFKKDNAPKGDCSVHVLVSYDQITKGISLGKCPGEDVTKVSLIKAEDRSFPLEVYITDAEFVYKNIKEPGGILKDDDMPYFYHSLPEGEYSGISNKKRQFNRACPNHR